MLVLEEGPGVSQQMLMIGKGFMKSVLVLNPEKCSDYLTDKGIPTKYEF